MYRICETVRSTHSQDGGIILDIHHGQMFRLNITGSRILALLKSDCGESEIVNEISRQFGISQDLAETDVREFILALKNHGLVEQWKAGSRP